MVIADDDDGGNPGVALSLYHKEGDGDGDILPHQAGLALPPDTVPQ